MIYSFISFEYILKEDLHLLFFSWNMVLHINDLVLLYRYFLKTVSSPTPCHLPYFFAVLCREELAPFWGGAWAGLAPSVDNNIINININNIET